MMRISRRSAWLAAAVVLLGGAAAYLAKPAVSHYVWRARSDIRQVDAGGVEISYRDAGQGAPVVVIVSGMAVHKDSYYELQKKLSAVTRVLAYDRPGIGDSPPNADPRTLDYIDRDMKVFLEAVRAPPPYILVGHSLGGHIIRYYAVHHPDDVAGLVFLDAPSEDWFRYIRETWTTEEAGEYFKWWSRDNPDFEGVAQQEMLAYDVNNELMHGVRVPQDIPALMFTGNNTGHFRKGQVGQDEDRQQWAAMQAAMLDGVSDAKQIVDWNVGHMMYKDRPQWVADEIIGFVHHVRDQSPPAARARLNPPSPEP